MLINTYYIILLQACVVTHNPWGWRDSVNGRFVLQTIGAATLRPTVSWLISL
jgi:hypothetical protein